MTLLGSAPVAIQCEGCAQNLETFSLDERRGQLRPSTRGVPQGPAPMRAGHHQVLRFRCRSKACRREVSLSMADIESAVLRAMRAGDRSVTVGSDLLGAYQGEPVRTSTSSAKAPIPGAYRRPPDYPG